MNISFLKNTANVFKAFAVRFFDLYLIIYTLLVTAIILSGQNYIPAIIICSILLISNLIFKYILNVHKFYRNIGFKYGVCVIVLVLTYLVLCLITKKECHMPLIFLLSVFSLFGFYDTNMNMVLVIKTLFNNDKTRKISYVVKESDIGTSLCKLSTVYSEWQVETVEEDTVSKMLYEFLNVDNENQMGRLVVRSMTTCDNNDTEKICIKAKDKYQLIVRGHCKNIIDMCSEIVGEGELLQLDENLKNKISQTIDENKLFCKAVCCAFKEVDDISNITNDEYIFAGIGFYGYDKEKVCFDTVTDVSDKEKLINAFGENITVTTDTLENVITNLHDDNVFVCGKYTNCDGLTSPAESRIKVNIADNFDKSVNYIYLLLIAVILFSSNFLLSIFSADAFGYNEIIFSGVIIFLYSFVVVFMGRYKLSSNVPFYISCVLSSVAVLISYFIGRYIMINGEFINDLFYKVTASAMASVTLIICIALSYIVTVAFYNTKSKLFVVLLYMLMFLFFLSPLSKVMFQGYNISNIYISTGIFISLCSLILLKFTIYILSDRRNNNERQISD